MMGPDDKAAAGRGHLRAAHADREQVIAVLKAAFVQGRLTQDELEARAAQTFASKTYAELAAVTADIPALPADPAGLQAPGLPAPGPASTPARTLAKAARRSGVCLLIAVALTEGAFLANNLIILVLAFFAFMAASGFIGYGIIDARQQWRSRSQLRSQPGHGRGFRDGRPARPGPDPALPDHRTDHTRTDHTRADHTRADHTRTDHTRTDLRAHRTRAPRHPLWYSNTYRGAFGHRGVYWVLRGCRLSSRWRARPGCAHHLSLLSQRGLSWTATHAMPGVTVHNDVLSRRDAPVVSRPWSRSAASTEPSGRSSAR
jgi:Domain of unknown function (DUF1707)